MSFDILMPSTGKVLKWRLSPGDFVRVGDHLCDVETDKTVIEVEAEASGVLDAIHVEEGAAEVPEGHVLARLAAAAAVSDVAKAPCASVAVAEPRDSHPEPTADVPGRLFASMRARKIARESRLALDGLRGSGPNGRIVARDVVEELERREASRPVEIDGLKQPDTASGGATVADRRGPPRAHGSFSCEIELDRVLGLQSDIEELSKTTPRFPVTTRDFAIKAFALAITGSQPMPGDADEALTIVMLADGARRTWTIGHAANRTVSAIAEAIANPTASESEAADASHAVFDLAALDVERFAAPPEPGCASVLALGTPRRALVPKADQAIAVTIVTATLSFDTARMTAERAGGIIAEVRRLLEAPLLLMA